MTRTSRRGRIRFLRMAVFVVALATLLLPACRQDLPYNTLAPQGPVADKQDDLFTLVFWIAVGVFVIVEGLLVLAIIRFRRRSDADVPKQIHGNTRLEILWTILPALLLAGVAVPTVGTIFDLSGCRNEGMRVEVVGHQWWWEVVYPDLGITTANEIHVPAGEPVCVELTSKDVIHSFWVPRLAGKQDMVPGRTIELTLEAPEPGVYEGQCAEYCGLSHGIMLFEVVADERPDFDAWAQREASGAAAQPPEDILQIVTGTCMSCHAIRGVEGLAEPARPAPDLTHVASRRTIVGAWLPNSHEELARWLADPPAVKPGSRMPDYDLTGDQVDALVEYLRSLE